MLSVASCASAWQLPWRAKTAVATMPPLGSSGLYWRLAHARYSTEVPSSPAALQKLLKKTRRAVYDCISSEQVRAIISPSFATDFSPDTLLSPLFFIIHTTVCHP